MGKKITKGIELLDEDIGEGPEADTGTVLIYNARIFLRKGDEVTRDAEIISRVGDHLTTRILNGVELIDHSTELGKRRTIAGIEKTLYGMKKSGYREVIVSPHLAYGKNGIEGVIPPNALLRIQIWVQNVRPAT